MNTKKIMIIILAITVIGGVAGRIGYKAYLQKGKEQELEIQHVPETKSKNEQAEVSSKNEQSKVESKNEQIEVKSRNEQVKEDKLIHSNFQSKVQSYVAEFRKSGDDIYTFKKNLDSINTKNLNTEDKAKLNNLQLAAKDWSMFTEYYDYVRQTGDNDSYSEQAMKYAKEALDKVNTNNLIATGVMSKSTVDKYTSFLREYIEKKLKELDKQNKQELGNQEEVKRKELDKQHAQLKTIQEKEEFYYNIINEAMQRQIKYINSIKDPKVSQSVQSSIGAAASEETYLELLFPEDTKILRETLSKVTNPK